MAIAGGGEPERLTTDRHYLSGWDARPAAKGEGDLVAAVRSAAAALPEVVVLDVPAKGRAGAPRTVTHLNDALAAELSLVEPVERRWQSDGREIQGWLYPGGPGARPLVLEIHGGPHTLYGWSPVLEWQVLAGAGISVLASNPRGSEGYGEAFNRANLGDWGDGPMADVIAGVDQAIADGLADPDRLGVTGGSYGGYLTNWIIGRTDRFKAAVTCRSVVDMRMLFLTGDISGGEWAQIEFGRSPWDDPAYFDSISPISLAANMHTPLLIQHAERDLRTTVGQAEALFTTLRSLRRPVRFMRVPDESHELTRGGAPFRRAENIVQIRDWFTHFLVKGERRLPPPPRNRAREVARWRSAAACRSSWSRARTARSGGRSARQPRTHAGRPWRSTPRSRRAAHGTSSWHSPPATGTRRSRPRRGSWTRSTGRPRARAWTRLPCSPPRSRRSGLSVHRRPPPAASSTAAAATSSRPRPRRPTDTSWVAHNNDLSPASEASVIAIEWRVPGEPVVFEPGHRAVDQRGLERGRASRSPATSCRPTTSGSASRGCSWSVSSSRHGPWTRRSRWPSGPTARPRTTPCSRTATAGS